MVRPTREREVVPLTDAQSLAIGDGTEDGEDVDLDGGGTGGGDGGGIVAPPVSHVLEVVDGGSPIDLDFNVADWWDITIDQATTFTISNPPASGTVGILYLIIRQGSGAPWTVTWPAEVVWDDLSGLPLGSAPTLHTAADAVNRIDILTEDGGATYGGSDESATTGGGSTTFGTPAIVLGTAAAAGSIAEAIRRDSTIVAFDATVPVQDGGSAATGSAAVAARRDHKHPGDTVAIVCVIDGGGSTITTGIKLDLSVPFACTITGVRMLADVSGSIVVDIWKDTYANYPPVVGDSITASAKPTISTATKSEDTTLTGWTTSVSAGDTLRFNVDSVTSIARVVLTLKATRT